MAGATRREVRVRFEGLAVRPACPTQATPCRLRLTCLVVDREQFPTDIKVPTRGRHRWRLLHPTVVSRVKVVVYQVGTRAKQVSVVVVGLVVGLT